MSSTYLCKEKSSKARALPRSVTSSPTEHTGMQMPRAVGVGNPKPIEAYQADSIVVLSRNPVGGLNLQVMPRSAVMPLAPCRTTRGLLVEANRTSEV